MNYTQRTLREYLSDLGVPVELWGEGETKTLRHLVQELKAGECLLNGIVRRTHTVVLDVRYKDLRLREAFQVFVPDLRVRVRSLPYGAVSEKLKIGECADRGLWRALKEELKIKAKCGIKVDSLPSQELQNPSSSYPGLVTFNLMTRFRVVLPEERYKPDGYVEWQPDKSTYFDWISAE